MPRVDVWVITVLTRALPSRVVRSARSVDTLTCVPLEGVAISNSVDTVSASGAAGGADGGNGGVVGGGGDDGGDGGS